MDDNNYNNSSEEEPVRGEYYETNHGEYESSEKSYGGNSEEPGDNHYYEDRSSQFSGSDYNRYSEPGRNNSGNGLGIASMVLGISSLIGLCFCLGPITGLLAIIFGIIQLSRKPENRAFSIAGIITGVMGIILTVIITVIIALGVTTGGSGADSIFNMDMYEEILDGDLLEDKEI